MRVRAEAGTSESAGDASNRLELDVQAIAGIRGCRMATGAEIQADGRGKWGLTGGAKPHPTPNPFFRSLQTPKPVGFWSRTDFCMGKLVLKDLQLPDHLHFVLS